jgi:hypothetical protein
MDHTNDNEDFPLDLAQDLLEEDAIPDLGERLDLRTARPQFMSRLNFSLAVQDILSSLRNQCAEHATRLNVKPQTLFHSVLNITEKEKKNRKLTAWQAMVHVTREDLSQFSVVSYFHPHAHVYISSASWPCRTFSYVDCFFTGGT